MLGWISLIESHIPGPKLQDVSHWLIQHRMHFAAGPAHPPGAGPLLTVVRRHRLHWREGTGTRRPKATQRTAANRHPWATKPLLTHDAFGSRSSILGTKLLFCMFIIRAKNLNQHLRNNSFSHSFPFKKHSKVSYFKDLVH